MAILARMVMVVLWLALALLILLGWGFAWIGEKELIFDLFDLPAPYPDLTGWVIAVGFTTMAMTLSFLGWAFLQMSQMLRPTHLNPFFYLSRKLRHAAWGLLGFWVGTALIWTIMPILLTLNAKTEYQIPYGWNVLDTEVILLAVAIVFLALSRSLARAQEIEDDNKTIV